MRLYSWENRPLDDDFWSERLARAISLRTAHLGLAADRAGYRLVFSEGDGLSGLTVDRYDRWLVAQFTSLALHARRDMILKSLIDQSGALGVQVRTERGIAAKEGLRAGEEMTVGLVPTEPVEIVEHGLTYRIDLRTGQKTGFYLDQRVNRKEAAGYCRDRRVLDLFCFTGGFAPQCRAFRSGERARHR